jgi:hypothetical protein
MEAFLTWLQELPISVWVAESDTLWGFPFILVLHSFGIAFTAGTTTMMNLRLLGVLAPIPLSSFRKLLPIFWTGLIVNAITGTLLFMMAATANGFHPMYYAKLFSLALAVSTLLPIRKVYLDDGVKSDSDVPSNMRTWALVSLVLWAAVITTGRLIPYTR